MNLSTTEDSVVRNESVAAQMKIEEHVHNIPLSRYISVGNSSVDSRHATNAEQDNSNDFITSCVAICSKIEDLSNGVCSGIGCCQASSAKGVQSLYSAMTTLTDQRKAPELSVCGYAFLAEQINYDFNISDISDPSFLNTTTETVPIVLDWAIGSKTCNQIKNTGEAICQQNGVCVDSGTTLGGYRCNCSQGYQGNPYLSPGRILSNSNMRTSSSLLFLIFLYLAAEGANISKPGCPSKCGNLEVPYPFGIGVNSNCSINPVFAINCNSSFDPPKAFLSVDDVEVLGISEAQISVTNRPAKGCYDDQGNQILDRPFIMNLSSTSFSFSSENMLTVVGCDDAAFLSRDLGSDDSWPDLISSCVAICSKPGQLSNGFCSGIGCCQSSIPEGLQSIYVDMDSVMGHDKIHNFSTCGYSFLAGKSSYNFNVSDITDSSLVSRIIETVPVVIDWAIGNKTCTEIKNSDKIICQPNSMCLDSTSTLGGYRCSCSQGYQGNPYLSPGCQDINECDDKPCHKDATCYNLLGSFNCSCPLNYIGDGRKNGTGCLYTSPPRKLAVYAGSKCFLYMLVLLLPLVSFLLIHQLVRDFDLFKEVILAGSLSGLGMFLILFISFWSYKLLKKRSIKQIKQNLHKRNGGLLLNKHESILEKMRIFTVKELEKATDKFNESRILGRGGQGTVYKGMLSDGRIVAVKKSKQVNQNQLEDFINEVAVQSEVNHRNVVKLLGCCLETEVPFLVYEFIPNGTLHHLIHDHDTGIPFSWDIRLRIATEVANALAYIHYATSVPIYHRDMKSTNILLDEKYRAKLSDFGISRSAAADQTHLTTKVQGTIGYLDPEYFQTGKLTEKSDVYSFGVVLVELLTGQKPIETSMTEDEMSLVMRFLLTMEENRLQAILDPRITEQGVTEEHITVSNLAKRCLSLNGKKRPKIREVVMELESIRSYENPSTVESSIQNISFTDIDDSWMQQSDEFEVENIC